MARSSIRALVLGGSGNVGSHLVQQLSDASNYSVITLISRRPLPQFDSLPKVQVQIVSQLNDLDKETFEGYDVGYMLLGAGKPSQLTQEELFNVDATLPIKFGRVCSSSGIKHVSILSALGADHTQSYSSITKTAAGGGWYNHCKGIVEEEYKKLHFTSLSILQPAAIYPGNENTPSLFGALNQSLNWLLPGSINTISCHEIASAMIKTMHLQVEGAITGVDVLRGGHNIRLRS